MSACVLEVVLGIHSIEAPDFLSGAAVSYQLPDKMSNPHPGLPIHTLANLEPRREGNIKTESVVLLEEQCFQPNTMLVEFHSETDSSKLC